MICIHTTKSTISKTAGTILTVLVNRGGAEGKDIVALCDAIKRDVKDKFGIDIVPEVNII